MDLAKLRARRQARMQLALYKYTTADIKLDSYLQHTYNITLREACKKIIYNATFSLNLQQEIIVTITDPELNHLARIITYGTGKLLGSKIIRQVFKNI